MACPKETTCDSPAAADKPLVVLLVDDDPDCRALVRAAIETSGIASIVHEVGDGREALDFIHRRGRFACAPRPGLIYMDIEMPGLDGQAALAAIRSDPCFRDIPVVMMTGIRDIEQMRLAARRGANSYNLKQENADQFCRTVKDSTNYWLSVHQHPGPAGSETK